jgi:hypothetical protein
MRSGVSASAFQRTLSSPPSILQNTRYYYASSSLVPRTLSSPDLKLKGLRLSGVEGPHRIRIACNSSTRPGGSGSGTIPITFLKFDCFLSFLGIDSLLWCDELTLKWWLVKLYEVGFFEKVLRWLVSVIEDMSQLDGSCLYNNDMGFALYYPSLFHYLQKKRRLKYIALYLNFQLQVLVFYWLPS